MRHILIFLLIWGISFNLYSQSSPPNFTTLTYNQDLQNQGTNFTSSREVISEIERNTAAYVRLASTFEEKAIPIVIHNLYATEAQKISAAQVEAQLLALNNHFGLVEVMDNHPNDPKGIYAKRAVDTKIRFCLATEDATGKAINAINHIPTTMTEWTEIAGIKQSENGAIAITPDGLLNIWVVGLPIENKGFAQMPSRGDLQTDGVVINYRYFGNESQTQFGFKSLTYLVAQYLNLYPLTGHSLDTPCSDDYVSDTPISNNKNLGCPSGNHVSVCEYNRSGDFVPEMVMNFMSPNTDDACKYMFTHKQAARMHAILDSTGTRYDLVMEQPPCASETESEEAIARNNKEQIDEKEKVAFKVYPNPATSHLIIEVEDSSASRLEILNSEGKLVFSKPLTKEIPLQERISINHLNAGFYLVKITASTGTLIQKLTIE